MNELGAFLTGLASVVTRLCLLGAGLALACASTRTLPGTPGREPGEGVARSADGTPIHYRAAGQGSPALVFVHGWACDCHLWDEQLAHFAPRHLVVSLDLAGHGESGRGRKEWTIPAFGADVRAVVEKLEARRVILVGHSMAGPIVLEAAQAMPDRVAGIVVVDTLLNVEGTKSGPGELAEFFAPFERDFPAATENFLRQALLLPTSPPEVAERLVRGARAMPPEIAIPALRSAFAYDAKPLLGRTRVPFVAINSDRYPTNAEGARRYAPQYRLKLISGVAHYPMMEAPAEFDRLLEEAVREIGLGT